MKDRPTEQTNMSRHCTLESYTFKKLQRDNRLRDYLSIIHKLTISCFGIREKFRSKNIKIDRACVVLPEGSLCVDGQRWRWYTKNCQTVYLRLEYHSAREMICDVIFIGLKPFLIVVNSKEYMHHDLFALFTHINVIIYNFLEFSHPLLCQV